MGNYAKNTFLAFIREHCSPLCQEPEKVAMFSIHPSEDITLGVFAQRDNIVLQLTRTGDAELTVTFFDFDIEESVETVLFSYNDFNMQAYIDKRKARRRGEMVVGMSAEEDDNDAAKYIMEELRPSMQPVCNALVGMTLTILSEVFKRNNLGITLADFGYINFD